MAKRKRKKGEEKHFFKRYDKEEENKEEKTDLEMSAKEEEKAVRAPKGRAKYPPLPNGLSSNRPH
ncbi:hypothetical protein KKA27_04205 [Patescibacteria group bacterium]|nr:hypothetical protein [Patescibacteria group bacterium]